MKQDLEAIVFMKFGYHAMEGENDIILRKRNEYINTGKIFWGYGGVLCHPLNQIQPFLKAMNAKGKKVYLAMSFTKSKPITITNKTSSHFSADFKNWKDIPLGIKVTGSKYAIICSNLVDCEFKINLHDYMVAFGPSKGKNASEYIAYRVDKGCLIKNESPSESKKEITIQLIAEIIEPFAVMLK